MKLKGLDLGFAAGRGEAMMYGDGIIVLVVNAKFIEDKIRE